MLRTGTTTDTIVCVIKAPSTLRTFQQSFRWGHVRQLDQVSRELLARVWAAEAGPGDGPLTIDLDSTFCETLGLAKEDAQRHNYAGQQGYHPFHAIVAACRKMDVRFSVTVRQNQSVRNIIEAISEADWTPILYWMEGTLAVTETTYAPFESKPDAAPVQLIVRRVKPTPKDKPSITDTAAPNWRTRRGYSGRPCRRPPSSGPDVRSHGWARRSGPCVGPCPPARCGR